MKVLVSGLACFSLFKGLPHCTPTVGVAKWGLVTCRISIREERVSDRTMTTSFIVVIQTDQRKTACILIERHPQSSSTAIVQFVLG